MPDYDDDLFALRPYKLQTMANQASTDSPALMFRKHGNRRQRNRLNQPALRPNPHPAEQDVSHNASIELGDEGDHCVPLVAKPIYQRRLFHSSKRRYVDSTNRRTFCAALTVLDSNQGTVR